MDVLKGTKRKLTPVVNSLVIGSSCASAREIPTQVNRARVGTVADSTSSVPYSGVKNNDCVVAGPESVTHVSQGTGARRDDTAGVVEPCEMKALHVSSIVTDSTVFASKHY